MTVYIGTLKLGSNKREPDKDAIKRLSSMGFTRKQIAVKMRIPYSTLCNYIAQYESYKKAFEEGEEIYKKKVSGKG